MKIKMPECPPWGSLVGCAIVRYALPFFVLSATANAQVNVEQGSSGSRPPQFDYGVNLGGGYSDNIARTSSDQRSETYALAGLNLVFNDDSRALYSNSQIDVAYLNYLRNTFSDEVVGNANINLDARIAPGAFDWVLLDSFGQVRPDPYAPASPENRENVNYLTTGPRFTAHLSSTNRAQLGGHYSKITYQRSHADNDRYGGNIAFLHDFSSASNVSLNVTSERTSYATSTTASDYDTNSAYLDFTLVGSRTKGVLDFGYTQVKRTGEDDGGALVHLQLERQLTPSTRLTLRGGRELTNSGDVFRSDQSVQPISLSTGLATTATDTLVRKYLGASWNFSRARTGLGVNVDWSNEEHQQQTGLDRKAITATAYLSRQITPSLHAQLSASYVKEDFDLAQTDSKDLSQTFELSWRVGQELTTRLQIQHDHRAGGLANGSYSENRVWLLFVYGNASASSSAF